MPVGRTWDGRGAVCCGFRFGGAARVRRSCLCPEECRRAKYGKSCDRQNSSEDAGTVLHLDGVARCGVSLDPPHYFLDEESSLLTGAISSLVGVATSPSAPGADPPKRNFLPSGKVILTPT